MYQVELRGKISSRLERMEDVLTSNVFSFFKYADRSIFLKRYLNDIGFKISTSDAEKASFYFWPTYENNTEPDLVIMVGSYYILFEAKYYSGFGAKTEKKEAQLVREVKGGLFEAEAYEKEFVLIAITADHIYRDTIVSEIPTAFHQYLRWTNWQHISIFLEKTLSATDRLKINERLFAEDLIDLLDRKKLRGYWGAFMLEGFVPNLVGRKSIFFNIKLAKFSGKFKGFVDVLKPNQVMVPYQILFFNNRH